METIDNRPIYLQPECTLMELHRKHTTYIQRQFNSTLTEVLVGPTKKKAWKVGKQIPGI
jgi:hypothetical protein